MSKFNDIAPNLLFSPSLYGLKEFSLLESLMSSTLLYYYSEYLSRL